MDVNSIETAKLKWIIRSLGKDVEELNASIEPLTTIQAIEELSSKGFWVSRYKPRSLAQLSMTLHHDGTSS